MISGAPRKLHGGQFLPGAHHPHCSRHDHHLIWIGRRPLCLGCTSLYSGIVMGTLVVWMVAPNHVTMGAWILIHLTLLFPTVVQPFLQVKIFKIFSRTLLGVCCASYFLTGFFVELSVDRWIFFLSQLVAFVLGYLVLSKWRARRIDNPCSKCPLGHFPVCEWNLPRLIEDPDQNAIFGEAIAVQTLSRDESSAKSWR